MELLGSLQRQEARRQFQQQGPGETLAIADNEGNSKRHTANPTGAPLPAGLDIPAPAARAEEAPPGALAPNLALGSAGGGDSTEREMI